MEANVILSKCSVHKGTFGIRIEKRNNDWVWTWAFKIDEAKAKREGFDRVKITGSLHKDHDFPGCPYCGEKSGFVTCGCGGMICWNPEKKSGTCPWCESLINEIRTVSSIDIRAGGY